MSNTTKATMTNAERFTKDTGLAFPTLGKPAEHEREAWALGGASAQRAAEENEMEYHDAVAAAHKRADATQREAHVYQYVAGVDGWCVTLRPEAKDNPSYTATPCVLLDEPPPDRAEQARRLVSIWLAGDCDPVAKACAASPALAVRVTAELMARGYVADVGTLLTVLEGGK